MKGYSDNIENITKANNNFRKVLYTGKHNQLVVMSLKPGEEIGAEIHPDHDQFFRIDAGEGKCVIDGNEYAISDGFAVVVPAGANHNVINTGTDDLKLYTIYSPAEHRDGVVHPTKADALADASDHFDGKPTE